MDRESGVYNCDQCEYIRMYDYGKRIYYCDHENRRDDMGKLGINELPKRSPEWCPLRKISKGNIICSSKN